MGNIASSRSGPRGSVSRGGKQRRVIEKPREIAVPLLRQLGDYYREASGANGPTREAASVNDGDR